jgi:hypothetical protein
LPVPRPRDGRRVQVENQVGLVCERFFTPRLRFKSYDELNAWLLNNCLGWAKAHAHPEWPERTIWEIFEEERPKLIAPNLEGARHLLAERHEIHYAVVVRLA